MGLRTLVYFQWKSYVHFFLISWQYTLLCSNLSYNGSSSISKEKYVIYFYDVIHGQYSNLEMVYYYPGTFIGRCQYSDTMCVCSIYPPIVCLRWISFQNQFSWIMRTMWIIPIAACAHWPFLGSSASTLFSKSQIVCSSSFW